MQDEVLAKFMERASEFEQAAGSLNSKIASIDSETK
jgi:hypothetical protein